jgi:hypothetical protein
MLAGCAGSGAMMTTPSAVASASPSMSPISPLPEMTQGPGHAEVVEGNFQLVFDLPKTVWHASEAITGTATLTIHGVDSVVVTGSGSGIVGFRYHSAGGDKHADWIWTADCGRHTLTAASPLVISLSKTPAYSSDAAPTDFYRLFAMDPEIHLPAGEWVITALTQFSDGPMCDGIHYEMEAPITIHVLP